MLHEKLMVYRIGLGLAGEISKEGARWPRGMGYLADQVRRAMASVCLNIAEGNARKTRAERRRFFEIARASGAEVSACLDLVCAFGLMNETKAGSLKSTLSSMSRMLWGLMK